MNESTVLDSAGALPAITTEPAARVTYRFEFRGNGAEYFRIWIVNLLLTLVTLGIFSAWAKVRRLRYFYGNTLLDDHSFEYHARPLAILKGRIIVFVLYALFVIGMQFYQQLLFVLVPLGVLGIPWVLLRARRFQMRMSSWRNVRFGFGGGYRGAMGAYMGWFLIFGATIAVVALVRPNGTFSFFMLLAIALLYPHWVHKRVEYTLDNSSYGREPFGFYTRAGRFYVFCIATAVITLVAYFAFVYLLTLLPGLREPTTPGAPLGALDLLVRVGPQGWLLLLVAAIVGYSIAGFYKSQLINASFGGLGIGANNLRSSLTVPGLVWINVTNLLGLLATLGMFYPWAKVRLARYQLEHMHIDSDGRLTEFLSAAHPDTSALGEEAGDFFDVDLGM
jgi:uncharacterized membrane protein YjgN (DUF898 family)